MTKRVTALLTAVLMLLGATGAGLRAAGPVAVEFSGATSGSVIDIAMNRKLPSVVADAQGGAATTLDFASFPKQEVRVYIDVCKDGRTVVHFVPEAETAMAMERDCDRKFAGVFWTHRVKRIVFDLAAGTMGVFESSGLPNKAKLLIGAAGGGAALAAVAMGGGSSSRASTPSGQTGSSGTTTPGTGSTGGTPFTPAGTYNATSSVKLDPAEHADRIALARALALVMSLNGSALAVICQNGQNFVNVTGTFDPATRRGVLTGAGVVAGRPNVSVRLDLVFTESGAVSGDYMMGANRELPTGQPAVYAIQGQRQ